MIAHDCLGAAPDIRAQCQRVKAHPLFASAPTADEVLCGSPATCVRRSWRETGASLKVMAAKSTTKRALDASSRGALTCADARQSAAKGVVSSARRKFIANLQSSVWM